LTVSELKRAKCCFNVSIASVDSLKHYVVIKCECDPYIWSFYVLLVCIYQYGTKLGSWMDLRWN